MVRTESEIRAKLEELKRRWHDGDYEEKFKYFKQFKPEVQVDIAELKKEIEALEWVISQ